MSTPKKTNKPAEDVQAALQAMITQGKKDGMIRCPKCGILVRVEDMKDNRRSE